MVRRASQEFTMTACASALPEGDAIHGPVIDRSVLGEWFGGDAAAVNELLIVFRDSALTEHARMAEALVRDDLAEYARAAHRLRGVALSMGAHLLATVAAALDAAAKANDRATCWSGMARLEAQIERMVAEVPGSPRPHPG
jgi:HPt (histidine-containing phosphotransfer) domain-containing protein